MSSALLARLWPGRIGILTSVATSEGALGSLGKVGATGATTEGDWGAGLGVDDVVPLESVRRVLRRYRSGEGFAGASNAAKDRSGTGVLRPVAEAVKLSTTDRLFSGARAKSSLACASGPTIDRLDDPEVEAVESDDDEGAAAWPSLTEDTGTTACCSVCVLGADIDLLSCRS